MDVKDFLKSHVAVPFFFFNHHDWKCFQTYIFIFEPCKVNNGGSRFKARLTAFAQEHRRNDVSTFIPSPFFIVSLKVSPSSLPLLFIFPHPPFSLAAHHSVSTLPLVAPVITAHIVICIFSSSGTRTCTHIHTYTHTYARARTPQPALDLLSSYCLIIVPSACLSITLRQNNQRAHILLSCTPTFDQAGSTRPDSRSCSAAAVKKNISNFFISLLKKERKKEKSQSLIWQDGRQQELSCE